MSKFRTVIPVAVAAILAKLPKGSYVHDIKMTPEKDGVEVIWDNDLIVARFQQIDFPPECFDGALPKDVVRVIGQEPVQPKLTNSETETAASPALEEAPATMPNDVTASDLKKVVDKHSVSPAGVGNNPVAPVAKKSKK